jgi:hypothetical protein
MTGWLAGWLAGWMDGWMDVSEQAASAENKSSGNLNNQSGFTILCL